jgi:hypothetical protein
MERLALTVWTALLVLTLARYSADAAPSIDYVPLPAPAGDTVSEAPATVRKRLLEEKDPLLTRQLGCVQCESHR